jgi:hypothetical protein
MAERVEFPPDRAPRVNWSRWDDGHGWRLRRGEDFHQESRKARKAFLSWAYRHDRNFHTHIDGDVLFIKSWPKGEPEPKD